jgi:hypothetical protein
VIEETMRWLEVNAGGDIPAGRYAHSFTVVDDKSIIMFGGASGKHYYNHLYLFNPRKFHSFNHNIHSLNTKLNVVKFVHMCEQTQQNISPCLLCKVILRE